MPHGSLKTLLCHLRALAGKVRADGDDALLDRFTRDRDEAAFAVLVRRHGPMVFGVCRRILGDADAAEDAFQATFLILARKAGHVRPGASVGSYLHGIACRVAHKARVGEARRRQRERQAARPDKVEHGADAWPELRPILDEELGRLPEKLRAPVVLCYLEGKTQTEAAAVLGWTKGTVSGRIARAKEVLRQRLTRRGVTLSATGLGAILAEQVAPAALAPGLLDTATRAGIALATGQALAGLASTETLSLAQGVLHAMFLTKVKIAASLVVGVVLLGAGAWTYQVAAQERKAKEETPKVKADAAVPVPSRRRELLEAQIKTAEEGFEATWTEFQAGRGPQDRGPQLAVIEWSRRWVHAHRELARPKTELLQVYKTHFTRMEDLENLAKTRFEAGRVTRQDLAEATWFRREAELWLEEARASATP